MTPKKLFILDGSGGFIAAFLTTLIIVFFDSYFGVPNHWLIVFIIFEIIYGLFSITVALTATEWLTYLRVIATANSLYGVFTIIVIVSNRNTLTVLDIIYFSAEIFVLASLIWMEIKMIKSIRNTLNG